MSCACRFPFLSFVQYCEQVKGHPQSCLQISLALLQVAPTALPAQELATARHFALHGLQHLIGHNWNQLGEEEKKYIKAQAVTIAENVRHERRRGGDRSTEKSDDIPCHYHLSPVCLFPCHVVLRSLPLCPVAFVS